MARPPTTGSDSTGIRERLPVGGGTWAVSWDAGRTESDSIISTFSPALSSSLQAAFSQPLLRDLKIDVARQQLLITKRNRELSDVRFREVVAQTTSDVKRAYWDLVAARSNIEVQQQSLALATDLARINKARVDVGQAPPLDLVSAEAEVAQRREQVIVAVFLARDVEDRLRTLIMDPADAGSWTTGLLPVDRPDVGAPLPDVDLAVAATLSARADIVRAQTEAEIAGANVRVPAEPAPARPAPRSELPGGRPRRRPVDPRGRLPGNRRGLRPWRPSVTCSGRCAAATTRRGRLA